MSPISTFQFQQMQARLANNNARSAVESAKQSLREVGQGGLQSKIREWCNAQWPRWVIFQARSDKKSTLAEGANDMVIFAPFPKVLLIEAKARGNKPSQKQLAWAAMLQALGWKVHFVWSMEEFLSVAEGKQ